MLIFQIILQILITAYIIFIFVSIWRNYRGYKEVPQFMGGLEPAPLASVIVPARNEEINIKRCINSICKQTYPHLEVIVIDDGSTDGTASIVKKLQKEYPSVTLIRSRPLADGWKGKSWALHQGFNHCKGEWLLFVDADTVLKPTCLADSLSFAIGGRIDMLSMMLEQELRTAWQKIILPVVYQWFSTRFSLGKVNNPEDKQALAVGQFMLIKREAYVKIGGHKAVRSKILENCELVKTAKEARLSYKLVGGKDLASSRIYESFWEIWEGWERLFIGHSGKTLKGLITAILIIGLTSIAPFSSLIFDLVTLNFNPVLNTVVAIQLILILFYRSLMNYTLKIPQWYTLLHPIGGLLAVGICFRAIWDLITGEKIQIKGRTYKITD